MKLLCELGMSSTWGLVLRDLYMPSNVGLILRVPHYQPRGEPFFCLTTELLQCIQPENMVVHQKRALPMERNTFHT